MSLCIKPPILSYKGFRYTVLSLASMSHMWCAYQILCLLFAVFTIRAELILFIPTLFYLSGHLSTSTYHAACQFNKTDLRSVFVLERRWMAIIFIGIWALKIKVFGKYSSKRSRWHSNWTSYMHLGTCSVGIEFTYLSLLTNYNGCWWWWLWWHQVHFFMFWTNISIIKCGMKLSIHPQTSTVQPLNFGNG